MVTRPTRKITIINELKMENQWICRQRPSRGNPQNKPPPRLHGLRKAPAVYPMLKEVRVEVLVKALVKGNGRVLKVHLCDPDRKGRGGRAIGSHS
jgi:hypothetical protein